MFIAGMLDRLFWFFGPIASATGLPRKENNLSLYVLADCVILFLFSKKEKRW